MPGIHAAGWFYDVKPQDFEIFLQKLAGERRYIPVKRVFCLFSKPELRAPEI
jgi:hypothetical protein